MRQDEDMKRKVKIITTNNYDKIFKPAYFILASIRTQIVCAKCPRIKFYALNEKEPSVRQAALRYDKIEKYDNDPNYNNLSLPVYIYDSNTI